MKNTFCFMLKAFFVLEMFIFLSWLFVYVEKRLDKKAMANFKFYDVTEWARVNYNTHISQHTYDQYLKKHCQPDNKIWLVNRM